MSKIEFSEFKNCKLNSEEILENIKNMDVEMQKDIVRYLYSLLFHTNIKVEDERDLQKIVMSYMNYKEGNFVTVDMV